MGLCLVAVLGVGVLCSNSDDKKTVVVSDFCQIAGPQIAKFNRLSNAEISALERPRKEAIVTLKKQHKALCK
jgi:hypothetical protein